MSFVQQAPQLTNTYRSDATLRALLRRLLPEPVRAACEFELDGLGELAAGALYRLQSEDRSSEPCLVSWDAWGNRIDRVTTTAVWQQAQRLAAEHGLVAEAYEQRFAQHSRLVQFAKVYLLAASTDVYSCPLAMTDGAARALLDSGNAALIARAVPHLTSRDPAACWTSGQWMTEATGGSDVGASQTVARREAEHWRLYGRKWFTSAIGSQMALTLARPEGNPGGGRGLALFYVETRDECGALNGIRVNRLKDKLGTRKVPTAELELEGTLAQPVGALAEGVKQIAPMLNVTRLWNSVVAVALMRRGVDLARDYALRRHAFGGRLADKPLHRDTLAGIEAQCQAALHLTFFVAELMGRAETQRASEQQLRLLRLLTPLTKALTGRQAVTVLTEAVEAFGGAGYVEDTGIALLLRDAHVLPIWEGTSNVLALDALRTLVDGGMEILRRELDFILQAVRVPALLSIGAVIEARLDRLATHLQSSAPHAIEADARRIAFALARCTAAALMMRHAQWAEDAGLGPAATAAARRFVQHSLGSPVEASLDDTAALLAGTS